MLDIGFTPAMFATSLVLISALIHFRCMIHSFRMWISGFNGILWGPFTVAMGIMMVWRIMIVTSIYDSEMTWAASMLSFVPLSISVLFHISLSELEKHKRDIHAEQNKTIENFKQEANQYLIGLKR